MVAMCLGFIVSFVFICMIQYSQPTSVILCHFVNLESILLLLFRCRHLILCCVPQSPQPTHKPSSQPPDSHLNPLAIPSTSKNRKLTFSRAERMRDIPLINHDPCPFSSLLHNPLSLFIINPMILLGIEQEEPRHSILLPLCSP